MPPPPHGARDPRLEALLRDLGSRVRQGPPPEAPRARLPTGLPAIDRLLGGGFPRGGLAEIAGPPSSGRTSLVLALLAGATERGEVAAVVDLADAFDPPSAAASGVDLARILWVRPPDAAAALRGTSHLLATRGFAALILDLAQAAPQARRAASRRRAELPDAGRPGHGLADRRPQDGEPPASRLWPRLRREIAATDTALIVLSDQRLVQGFADLALDLLPAAPRFEGSAGPPGTEGALLVALESEVLLVRDRRGFAQTRAEARWPARRRSAVDAA
jgi:recA bacterial DNA recombination protein